MKLNEGLIILGFIFLVCGIAALVVGSPLAFVYGALAAVCGFTSTYLSLR